MSENSMDPLPIEESACYRRLRDPRIVDSEPFKAEPCFWACSKGPAHEREPNKCTPHA
jgi:hypothetical protein